MTKEAGIRNPYQRRHDTKDSSDQIVYVDREFRASVNTCMIQLYACGILHINPAGRMETIHVSHNSSLAFYWVIIYVSSGKGTIDTGKNASGVSKGDVIVLRPETGYTFHADQDLSVKQKLLILVASPVTELICGRGKIQPCRIFHLKNPARFESVLDRMLDTAEKSRENPRMHLSVLAYEALCELDKEEVGERKYDKFNQIIFSIRQAPQYYRNVADLAGEFGISERSLFYMFRRRLGVSPIQHIIAERLEKSRWYLLNQSSSIAVVAELCGYSSAAFFSREFNRAYGISPLAYRNHYLATGEDAISDKKKS